MAPSPLQQQHLLTARFTTLGAVTQLLPLIIRGGEGVVCHSPLTGSAKAMFIAALAQTQPQIVVLQPDERAIDELTVELTLLGLRERLIPLAAVRGEKLQEAIGRISRQQQFILIAPYRLLTAQLPGRQFVNNNTLQLTTQGSVSYEELLELLNLYNYQKEKFVQNPGEFSQRGAIIDFWSYSEGMPVRVEFDIDTILSLRYFDPESQRSIEPAATVTVSASYEAEGAGSSTLFDYLTNPLLLAVQADFTAALQAGTQPQDEAPAHKPAVTADFEDEFPEEEPAAAAPAQGTGTQPQSAEDELLRVPGTRWLLETPFSESGRVELGLTPAPAVHSNYKRLFAVLSTLAAEGITTFIAVENEFQQTRLQQVFEEAEAGAADLVESGSVRFTVFPVKEGFIARDARLALITDYQIFNKPYRTRLPAKRAAGKARSKELASIKPGDFVVHEDYGVARYQGLESITIGEAEQETMKLLYAEGGVVYVNLNYLHLVKKFAGKEGFTPTVNKLGSTEWVSAKKKTKKRIKEAARELIELYARRKSAPGYRFSLDSVWQRELEASFMYEDTPDQSKVTAEIKEDMSAGYPMDRLVCGDVGFGKTEVAVRAAFKAAQDGKQCAVLVPTTILAEQHFNTFTDRLSQFPVKIAVISRFQSKAEQAEIVKGIAEGKLDIVIGTHRLLSKDVEFKDLGLLVIDEEHRFGVMAKEKLRSLKANVDTLTLTATPIPRTLNLSLLGARDLSIIATPPPNRQPVYTRVEVFSIAHIRQYIRNELARQGQVYFVHDRIQSIEKLSAYLKRHIPEISIGIAHGQMKPQQLEDVFHGFLNKKFDVLLSTKIIESGLDIPNVNTIIINRADRFGLAELHQLRGRVGRSDRQGYAYFLVPTLDSLNKNSVRRLQAIEEFTELGAGFNLSMRDLEIRGAGNLLGIQQSGEVNEIGFDMYLKLINEAVEELKQEEFKEVFKHLPKEAMRTDPGIDAFFELGIPKAYMADQMDRLGYYTALYSIGSPSEIQELRDEMVDRFGKPPVIVERLMQAALLKFEASRALFERVIIQKKGIIVTLPKSNAERFYEEAFNRLMRLIMERYANRVRFEQNKDTLKLRMPYDYTVPEKAMEFLTAFAREAAETYTGIQPEGATA